MIRLMLEEQCNSRMQIEQRDRLLRCVHIEGKETHLEHVK